MTTPGATPMEEREIGAEAIEAACKGYWPAHWPHQFDPKDAASIRANMANALRAAALTIHPAQHEAAGQRVAEDAIAFIEGLAVVPLLMGDDIEMRLEDVQEHARIEAASLSRRFATRPVQHEAVRDAVLEEAAKLEAVYQLGVKDACEMIGPPEDMTDAELTQYGRDKRQVVNWARRKLLVPGSGWRSDATRKALRSRISTGQDGSGEP